MTSRLPLALLVVAVLASCGQPMQTTDPAPPAPATSAHETALPVASLAGEWRVAGIDGQTLDEPIGLSLTGDARQLWWQPRCAGVARAYLIDGQRISFRSTEPPRPAGSPTPPVCAIGLPPRIDEVTRALDGATSISRTAGNGVLISGPDHSLTLFSQ